MVPVLFTMPGSVYESLGCDCYDETRDALTWPGGRPAIYHPPCRLWSIIRRFSTAPAEEKGLALWSMDCVRRWGGVVEHPAKSTLFRETGCEFGGRRDRWGGWVLSVDQHWFGHPARKKTWLYVVGVGPREIPPYPIMTGPVCYQVGGSRRKGLPECKKSERIATPIEFAKYLIALTKLVKM